MGSTKSATCVLLLIALGTLSSTSARAGGPVTPGKAPGAPNPRRAGHRFSGDVSLPFYAAAPGAKLGIHATPDQWQAIMQQVEPRAFRAGDARLARIVRSASSVGVPVELILAIENNETHHLLSPALRVQDASGSLAAPSSLPAPPQALGDIQSGQPHAIGPLQYDFHNNPARANRMESTQTPQSFAAFQGAIDIRENIELLKTKIPANDLLAYTIASWNGGVGGQLNSFAQSGQPHTFDPAYVSNAQAYITKIRAAARSLGIAIDQ